MDEASLKDAGIAPTTIRIAVGDEDARQLISHLIRASELILPEGFADQYMQPAAVDALYRETYLNFHTRWVDAQPTTEVAMQ